MDRHAVPGGSPALALRGCLALRYGFLAAQLKLSAWTRVVGGTQAALPDVHQVGPMRSRSRMPAAELPAG
jgi:hypothetical protein